MKRRPLIIAGCLALAVAAIAIPLGMAGDSLANNATRGSVAYRLSVPDAIKAVPVLAECQPPLYDTLPAEGDRPLVHAVSYTSFDAEAVLEAALTAHFEGQGCTAFTGGALGDGFACKDGAEAYFQLRNDELCTFVSVAIIPDP